MRRVLLETGFVLVTLFVATPGAAQAIPEAPDEPTSTEEGGAQEWFQRGLRHVEREELADAVSAFERSLEILPRVSTALNLALALQAIGHVRDAIRVLGQVREGRYGRVASHLAPTVSAELAHAETLVATANVSVVTAPDNQLGEVQVAVDGVIQAEREGRGAISFRIDPGRHVIAVTSFDHEPVRQVVVFPPGVSLALSIELTRARDTRPGVLIIESTPSTHIEIEGHGTGIGALRLELPPETYRVKVTGDVGSEETVVDLPPGRRVRLYLEPPRRLVRHNPWLWAAVGVLAAGAAATIGWKLSTTERDPIQDPVWGNTFALGAR